MTLRKPFEVQYLMR